MAMIKLNPHDFKEYKQDSLFSLITRYRWESDAKAEADHEKYRRALREKLGHDRFEVTDIMCSETTAGHVYTWDSSFSVRDGVGQKNCVFCGQDDFDGY